MAIDFCLPRLRPQEDEEDDEEEDDEEGEDDEEEEGDEDEEDGKVLGSGCSERSLYRRKLTDRSRSLNQKKTEKKKGRGVTRR